MSVLFILDVMQIVLFRTVNLSERLNILYTVPNKRNAR